MSTASEAIRFSDGDAYERFMGAWSRLVGASFLAWLAPAPALRWLDVGCGNGAFTSLLAERLEPLSIAGIDPSEQQLAYARAQPSLREAQLLQAGAMELPFGAAAFDSAVMPLVLPFVPVLAGGGRDGAGGAPWGPCERLHLGSGRRGFSLPAGA